MSKTFNWGIIGLGGIAATFASAVRVVEGARVYAAASRTMEKANQFADRFGARLRYDDASQLVKNPDIDAVYISNLNPYHFENIMLCLQNKKAVLCEKPLTLNAKQARAAIDCARANGVFFMEAMWTRFLPVYENVREWLDNGLIGEVRRLNADYGVSGDWEDDARQINLQEGGGALIDVGVYPIALSWWVFRSKPSSVVSMPFIGHTNVDEQCAMIFGYEGKNRLAALTSALTILTSPDAWIYGTKGMIHIPKFVRAQEATLIRPGEKDVRIERPHDCNGFEYQIRAVMESVAAGKTECAKMPLDESLEIQQTMDAMRAQWGLVYPQER